MRSSLSSIFATVFCIFLLGCTPESPTGMSDSSEDGEEIVVEEEGEEEDVEMQEEEEDEEGTEIEEEGEEEEDVEIAEESEEEDEVEVGEVEYFCEAKEHTHPLGVLTAEYEAGVLVRWRCTLSSHHICTAPADGVWTECTYEPPGWPEPVAQKFLQNPPEAMDEESEDYDGEEYDEAGME